MKEWRLTQTLKTERGTVAWDRMGTGPATVFIHGTPWSSFVWREIAIAVSAQRNVYVYDLPGFGASEKYAGQNVSLAAQAQVLAELLDAWSLEAPAVVAHDIGGAIALRAALLDARPFASLALLDPRGQPVRTLGAGAGLVAATAQLSSSPTWLVTGVDAAGVSAAADALTPKRLANHFALAVQGQTDLPVPLQGAQ